MTDATRIGLLLQVWGQWVSISPPHLRSTLVSGAYVKKDTPVGFVVEHDDLPLLIDRAIAAMPQAFHLIQTALTSRYVFNKSNYEGANYCRISETVFRDLIRQGHAWVYGYLMAHCPHQRGALFDLLNDDPTRVAMKK